MATTAVVAEILIVGLEAMAWLTLLVLTVFSSDWIEAGTLSDFAALTTIAVLAGAYVLGILIDRAADSMFGYLRATGVGRWLNRRFGRYSLDLPLPASFATMRMEALREGGALAAFLEYQRSRLRVVRGTSLNLAIGAPVVFVFLWRNAERWQAVVAAALILLGVAGSVAAAERIRTAYLERLIDAYKLVRQKRKKRRRVVAAICHRPGSHGPELLLVRTSDGRRWTFPKGHVEKDESPREAVAREAREEAGVSGGVGEEPIARYHYRSSGVIDEVDGYLLAAADDGEAWLAEPWRRPKWVSFDKARRLVRWRRDPRFAEEHQRVLDHVERILTADGERG
jgi:8-oxo-dGTP pyrophosphatase MutT (NUDIX family)